MNSNAMARLSQFRIATLRPRSWRRIGALLCVLLLACLTTVAVAHVHHDLAGDTGDRHCQLCQLSHNPATAPTQIAVAVTLALAALTLRLMTAEWPGRIAVRDTVTRPPPATR